MNNWTPRQYAQTADALAGVAGFFVGRLFERAEARAVQGLEPDRWMYEVETYSGQMVYVGLSGSENIFQVASSKDDIEFWRGYCTYDAGTAILLLTDAIMFGFDELVARIGAPPPQLIASVPGEETILTSPPNLDDLP